MSTAYTPATFTSRWRITGTLKTESLLHIGSGDTTTRKGITAENSSGKNQAVLIKAIVRDAEGHPFIPGASLRGVLRARLQDMSEVRDRLFGSPDAQRAGQIIVHDCRLLADPPADASSRHPFYEKDQHTAVIAGAAISRRTRTVADEKLFHREAVPPGAVFRLEIQADNAAAIDLHFVLRALLDGITAGADSGDGWGRLSFQPDKIEALTPEAVADWVKGGNPLAPPKWSDLTDTMLLSANQASSSLSGPQPLTLPLTLNFTGFFLTKDPDKSRKLSEKENAVTHSRLIHQEAKDLLLLPASSVRGVLRSHAERILRTLGLAAGDPTATEQTSADWDGSSLSFTARDLAAQMFGAPGWKSPIEISNFTGTPNPVPHEMVAIDRFTGGAVPGKKFTTKPSWAPVLTGHLTIRTTQWERAGCATWAPALLALVFRDLAEGDLRFGLGAARGYGHCTADVPAVPGADEAALKELLALADTQPA